MYAFCSLSPKLMFCRSVSIVRGGWLTVMVTVEELSLHNVCETLLHLQEEDLCCALELCLECEVACESSAHLSCIRYELSILVFIY